MLKLSLKQLRSAWLAGEVRVLVFALVLAVGAMTAVGFFTDRVQSTLIRQGAVLMGADLVVQSDRPIARAMVDEADRLGLRTTRTLEFPSMVVAGEASQLVEIKAVDSGYPLRGELWIAPALFGQSREAGRVPAPGEIWIEPRLASVLDVGVGQILGVGERAFPVGAILQRETARGGDMFSIAPRLMMHLADVEATGLIQYGSRVRYRLLIAGEPPELERYRTWAEPRMARGMRIEDASAAREEIRNALAKSRQFLGLAAMASVVLSMVAMALATLRYVRRHLDTCALLRCFGASQRQILQLFLLQSLYLGLIGSLLGVLLGYGAQAALAHIAGSLFVETLPPPDWQPALGGMLAGIAVMLGVMAPHLLHLKGVPALRILRRDLGERSVVSWLTWLPGALVMLGLVFWSARDPGLGAVMLGGLLGLLLFSCLVAAAAAWALRRLMTRAGGAWRLGLANLLRRPGVSLAQVAGFSLGFMALVLLALVRNDLLDNWQASLPPDAPNRFVINIQPDQLPLVRQFFAEEGRAAPEVHPMVRGRLVAINGKPVDITQYEDDRARRLAEREFNLSWSARMQEDNRIVAGRWWTATEHGRPLISMEEGIAKTLNLTLGDRLTYDIGGQTLTAEIQSLRKVEWDSMRANFFAILPPGVLDGYSASYITSFHLPAGDEDVLNRLVKRLPNLTVIDVAAVLEQLRGIMDRMTLAVEFVFAFCLLSGLAVLYASLAATGDERLNEAAVLRTLGASRRQLQGSVLAEFAGIGVLAGLAATVAASLLAWIISERLLNIPYTFNPLVGLVTIGLGLTLVPGAAWLGLRRVVLQPPRRILQSI